MQPSRKGRKPNAAVHAPIRMSHVPVNRADRGFATAGWHPRPAWFAVSSAVQSRGTPSASSDVRLFSYKMTNDSGFAPNPFGLTLTLATCKPERWRHGNGHCTLQSASRGQEFVLDTSRYPGMTDWLSGLLGSTGTRPAGGLVVR